MYSMLEPQTPVPLCQQCQQITKHTQFNALHALIFVSTVSTKNIAYTIHNSIALIFCIDCLNMPFNVHLNYNVVSNTKTSNYMKI